MPLVRRASVSSTQACSPGSGKDAEAEAGRKDGDGAGLGAGAEGGARDGPMGVANDGAAGKGAPVPGCADIRGEPGVMETILKSSSSASALPVGTCG